MSGPVARMQILSRPTLSLYDLDHRHLEKHIQTGGADMSSVVRFRAWSVSLAVLLFGPLLLVCATPLSGAAQPATPGWSTFAGNSQHTGLSSTAAQSLEVVHWSAPVDLAPPAGDILIHYGSPLVTPANTVIIPVKKGATGGYRVDARAGKDGSLIWSKNTDYILPPHNWTPVTRRPWP